jgi:(p)ppGpp synthase/HD superfamily hydrolase
VVEGCGGRPRLAEISQQFGEHVAAMVEALSDASPMAGEAKPPWRDRKQAYLDHLADLPERVLLISACDKLHNASSILNDLEVVGVAVFDRFKGGKDGTLWYYRSLADKFEQFGPTLVVRRLSAVVGDIELLCAQTAS